jgi:hypothetical protein
MESEKSTSPAIRLFNAASFICISNCSRYNYASLRVYAAVLGISSFLYATGLYCCKSQRIESA